MKNLFVLHFGSMVMLLIGSESFQNITDGRWLDHHESFPSQYFDGTVDIQEQQIGMKEPESNMLMVTIMHTNVLCNGGNTGTATATASGGSIPYTYNWSNGGQGPTISNLLAGTYMVTVTDIQSATATASVTITQPSALNLTSTAIVNISCFGGNNGSITVSSIGGIPPFNYVWSNGGQGPTISNLIAGSYTVTVTDNNNCIRMATYTVTQPPAINISLVELIHETCAAGMNGSIAISVAGGVNPISTAWSNGSSGLTIAGLAPMVYTVTVTDANNCTKTSSYTINPGLNIEVQVLQLLQVTCFGESNGAIFLNSMGGHPPYMYMWSNGMSGASINGLAAGSYQVSITDEFNCLKIRNYQINQPSEITFVATTESILCAGDSTGSIALTVMGGTPPYQFIPPIAGDTTATTVFINNLPAGSYSVSVIDSLNCIGSQSFQITEPPAWSIQVDSVIPITCKLPGSIYISTPGYLMPLDSVVWTYPNGISGTGNTTSASFTISGYYSVSITDSLGCTRSIDSIYVGSELMLSYTEVEVCAGDSTGSIAFTGTGAGPYQLIWSTGDTSATISNLPAGSYSVTVTDSLNCFYVDSIQITEPPAWSIQVDSVIPISGSMPGAIYISTLGYLTPLDTAATAVWTYPNGITGTGNTTLNLITLSGYYSVMITDSLGCTRTLDSIYVDQILAFPPSSQFKTLKVFPVPSKDIIKVDLKNQISEAWIISMDGHVHKYLEKPTFNELDVRELKSGLYLLRVFDGMHWYFSRIVKLD